mgnify:CR=1 FL=1
MIKSLVFHFWFRGSLLKVFLKLICLIDWSFSVANKIGTNKIIEKNGIKIIGETNILNKLPVSSSNLYARNLFNFVMNLYDRENKKININLEDEIISKTLIK